MDYQSARQGIELVELQLQFVFGYVIISGDKVIFGLPQDSRRPPITFQAHGIA
jgi:hypothetical protein